jgi:hypothetical protein
MTQDTTIIISIERYEELIGKEHAYEAIKHAIESNYPFFLDIARALCFVKEEK